MRYSLGLPTPRRTGNVASMVALSLVALMGVAGLAIDGGRLMAERRHAQNAGDAAAVAAAIELYNGATAATARQTALTYAARNGYSNDGITNTVTVNIPPTSGPNKNDPQSVEVLTTRTMQSYFIKVVYPSAATPQVRGVAGWGKAPASDRAVAALNLKKKRTLVVKQATLDVDGPIHVNSNARSKKKSGAAAVAKDGARVTAVSIKVKGDYLEEDGGDFDPNPVTGVAPIADPLGLLKAPSTGGLPNYGSVSVGGSSKVTLLPGVYTKIEVKDSAKVTMTPGIYIIQGGDFKVDTTNDFNADKVMIHTTAGKFDLKVGGKMTFSAPVNGDYEGVTLFQSRTNKNRATIEIKKSSSDLMTGTLYVPNGILKIKGVGTVDGTQLIGNRVRIVGDGTVNLKFNPAKAAKTTFISLVE